MIAFTNTPSTIMLPIDQIIFLFFDMPIKLKSNETAKKVTIHKRTIKQIAIIYCSTGIPLRPNYKY